MLLLLVACATPVDTADTSDSGGDTDTGTPWTGEAAPLPTELVGVIEVLERASAGSGRLDATIWAGPLPTTQQVVAEEGDCRVLDGALTDGWSCEPECAWGSQSCIDGECVDWPARAPSGEVTVSGLVPGTAVLEVLGNGQYGSPSGFDGDLFGEGDPIVVTSAGGATPALELAATGVAPLDLVYSPIEPGQDMVLTWTPASVGRILVQLDTGWHGASSLTTVWCDTADDGELTIPGSLTGHFVVPSCGECEESSVRRATWDVVDFGAGPIELVVASEVRFVAWWGM